MTTELVAASPINKRTKRPMHPNSLKNLKPPFPPGTNGYNQGRMSLTERLRHQLAKEQGKQAEALVQAAIEGALKREPTPFKEVWDRVDGRLQDTPPVVIDNRQVNIFVKDAETRELLGRVAERGGLNGVLVV